MNGRIKSENTPEGRISALVITIKKNIEENYRKTNQGPSDIDYADIEDGIRALVRSLLIRARLNEREYLHQLEDERGSELITELYEWEAKMPKEFLP